VEAGARLIHVVDMDLALAGELAALEVVRAIAVGPAAVQASGGITREAEIGALLEAGAARVVLGSAALGDRALVTQLAESYGDRLVVGVEVSGEAVGARGRADLALSLEEVLAWLPSTRPARLLVTSVTRVGGRAGPDLGPLRRVLELGIPTIAAGGVASVEHLLLLRDAGAAGAVVGRAALEGELDIAAATCELGGGSPPEGRT
jgi:phosphoribosylformimino-5-aminoimidazole carboxamide ribonucleotide (ProFAR) isomerase